LDEQLSHQKTRVVQESDGGSGARRERVVTVELDGRFHELRLHSPEPAWAELARRRRERGRGITGTATDAVVSPMQGTVLKVEVRDGEPIEAGRVICVVEAMKMENEIVSHRDGVVADLAVAPGQPITSGQLICLVRSGEG
jgi:acetyl-CoA/propionyl-CoA carboxylase biotin carboxyl carrier protein